MALGMTKIGSKFKLLAWKKWLKDAGTNKIRLIRDTLSNVSIGLTLNEFLAEEAFFPGYSPIIFDPDNMAGPNWANNHWIIATGPISWEATDDPQNSETIKYAIWTIPDPDSGLETVIAVYEFSNGELVDSEGDTITKSFGFSSESCNGTNPPPPPPGEGFELMVDVQHNKPMAANGPDNKVLLWKKLS